MSGHVGFQGGLTRRAGIGTRDVVGGAPDRQVTDELVVGVRGQRPLPRHPVRGAGLVEPACYPVGKFLDTVGDAVDVVTRLRVLS